MSEHDEAQEEHRRFIEENYARIAGVARDGARTSGRGAVFMFEDAVLDAMAGRADAVTIEYVADGSEALRRRGGWPSPAHEALVGSYDPATSMIVLVGRRRGGRELFTYQLALAEAEPALVTLRSRIGDGDRG